MIFLKVLLERWRRHRARARAIAELRRYDDHLLGDLGIVRAQIVDYVDGRLARASSDGARSGGRVIDLSAYRRSHLACRPGCCADAA